MEVAGTGTAAGSVSGSSNAGRHRESLADLPPHRPPNWREASLFLEPNWVRFSARTTTREDVAPFDRERIDQLETLQAVDDAVVAITGVLERAGLTDQTVFVYTSDHGIHRGEHWSQTKFSAYEESIRVPFLMR